MTEWRIDSLERKIECIDKKLYKIKNKHGNHLLFIGLILMFIVEINVFMLTNMHDYAKRINILNEKTTHVLKK